MKIAILSPVWLPVPPQKYGGTELIVSLLTEELVRRGHDVTLFASGDSKTSAKLDSIFPAAIGNAGELKKQPLLPLLHYTNCFEQASTFDIIHSHAQYEAMFLANFVKTPVVHTIHGSFTKGDVPDDKILTLRHFSDQKLISISNAQRETLPDLNYVGTVYNGIPLERFPFSDKKGDYLLWLGRIVRKKGPLEAIEVAHRTGMKLKMVAAIDPVEKDFFEHEVKPQIDGEQITFHGEVSNEETAQFYRGAFATLVPISWHEPFGLVMVESMACGTPVVAYNMGSVPEVVEDSVTGYIVSPENSKDSQKAYNISEPGIDGMVQAVGKIGEIDRHKCRERVEKLFSVSAMVDGYEKVYQQLASST